MQDLYAVILAGGSGTRLWPRSRTHMPKQFLDLVGNQTMIQQTVERLLPILPPERICFIVGRQHAAELQRQLPDIPAANIFLEPSARGTGPCVGLAAMYLRHRNPNATMVSLHADHFIEHEDRFRDALGVSFEIASRGMLVTMGATPTYPETGYGYIERGEAVPAPKNHPVFRIARFREKPDRVTAEQMIASGNYYWNTGMFTWRLDAIMDAFGCWMPDFAKQLETIERNPEALEQVWGHIRNETIDRGIMERTNNSAVVVIDIGWNDIGSWATLHELLPHDVHGNVARGDFLAIDTTDSLIQGNGKLIATIGLKDVIIVETEDAILVCAKDRAQDVKEIVEQLKKQNRTNLL